MPIRNTNFNWFDISLTLKLKSNEEPHGLSTTSSSFKNPEYIRKSTGREVNISLLQRDTQNKITEGVKLELCQEEVKKKIIEKKNLSNRKPNLWKRTIRYLKRKKCSSGQRNYIRIMVIPKRCCTVNK